MSSQPIDHQHPVVGVVERVGCDLGSVAAVPLLSMTPEQTRAVLVRISQDEAQLAALKLRLLAHAECSEATGASGAATAADWLAIETRQVRRDARSNLKLAEKLEHHDCLTGAMGQGQVNVAQARAIVAALDRLPRSGEFAVTTEQRAAAEAHLVGLAAHHDAKALRVLGRHLFEVIAPELAERFEGHQLGAEEARALQRTTLTMWEDDEGTTHGRFRIPALHGQMLSKMILAISSPVRSATGDNGAPVDSSRSCGIDPDLPTPVRHGIAFTQLIESVCAEDLPKTG